MAVAPFVDAFEATAATKRVHVVDDVTAALEFLHRRGEFTDVSRPDLVVVDLRLGGSRGMEILAEMRDDPELRQIPVVATEADAIEDVARAYELCANAYVHRPTDAAGLERLAETLVTFWLEVAHLPPKS